MKMSGGVPTGRRRRVAPGFSIAWGGGTVGPRMAERKAKTARQRQAEATKKNIADAALRLFAEHGVAGTSTRSIAKQAGVSEGLIFHHFPDKMALLAAVAATRTTFGTEVVKLLEGADARPLTEVLDDMARMFSKLVVAGTPEAQLFNVLLGESRSNAELHALFRSVVARVTGAFAAYLKARVAAGEVREDLDLEVVARTTLGGLVFFFATHSHLSKAQWKRQAPAFAMEHMRLVREALRPPPPGDEP